MEVFDSAAVVVGLCDDEELVDEQEIIECSVVLSTQNFNLRDLELHDVLFHCGKMRLLMLALIHALIHGDLKIVDCEHSRFLITNKLVL